MNTIKELFNGNIYPFEAMSCTKESIAADNRLNNYLEMADEVIPKDGKLFFSDKVRNEVADLQNFAAAQAFEIGFSLGVRLIAESYKET